MAKKKKSDGDIPFPAKQPRMPPMPGPNGGPPRRKKQGADMVPAQQMPLMGEFDGDGQGMGMGMMGPTTEEKLAEWLATKVLPKNVPGLYFQLRQKSIDGEMMAHEWDAGEIEGQDPDSLASMFYGRAVEDAQGSNGVTAYSINAMRPSDSQSFSRCFFRLAQEDMGSGMDTEPGHLPEGHMAQAHRHSEVFARMLVGQTENVMRHYRDQNKELATHASRAIQLQVQVAEMFQRIQDRGMMRDIMLKRVMRKEERIDKVMGYAMQFLPDVLGKIGLVPGQQAEMMYTAQGMMTVLASMDENQARMAMMALPSPAHRDMFEKAYVMSKKQAAADAARSVREAARAAMKGGQNGQNGQANGHTNGHTNGNGAGAMAGIVTGLAPTLALHGGQPTAMDARTTMSPTNLPAQSGAAPTSSAVDLTDEECVLLRRVTTRVLDVLASLEGVALDMVLSRVPAEMREDIKACRQWARDRMETKTKAKPTEEEMRRLINLETAVVQLLAGLNELEVGMMMGQIPASSRDEVARMRAVIHSKMPQARV